MTTCPTCRNACLVFGSGRAGIHCAGCMRSFNAESLVGEFDTRARRAEKKAAAVVADFAKSLGGALPCGHTVGDLTWAPGTITSCGACRQSRQDAKKEKTP